jgi:signal transduction histidine kinase
MINQISSGVNNFKKYHQIIYSIVLIIFIPAAIIANTIIFTDYFKKNIDQELYNKAIAIGNAFNVSLLDTMADRVEVQNRLNRLVEFNSEIKSIDIIAPKGDSFEVIASADAGIIGRPAGSVQNAMAWLENRPVAFLTSSLAKNTINQQAGLTSADERFWVVIMPLKNAQGEKSLLLSMKISLKIMDELTKASLIRSYIILIFTILIIILLLANNTRLFEYAALYRKIKEVDQMKDEFISIASHELRTPVTGIKGYISLLMEGSFGKISEKARESLVLVQGAADRLATLVEDLLNVSRIEQGRLEMELVDLEPGGIIKQINQELKVQADEKKLFLKFSPHVSPLPPVRVDADKLKQVLINIIGNAIKYTVKGGVEILTQEKDKFLEIRIKDTGLGMNAQERERLFEKFYRVQNENTRKITGTGLGLWITKQLVELMKGKIMVDSIEGVGTQVTVMLPLAKKPVKS